MIRRRVDAPALGRGGGEGKGVKGGLFPGRTIRARHDRCDHLDELGEGSAVDPVCVIEQSDQQIAHDHRYGEEVFEERGFGPVGTCGGGITLVGCRARCSIREDVNALLALHDVRRGGPTSWRGIDPCGDRSPCLGEAKSCAPVFTGAMPRISRLLLLTDAADGPG